MIVLLGKSGSGKSKISNHIQLMGFDRIIPYTTRPIREGEKNGVEYNYISEKDFINKVNENFFAEWTIYETECGSWYYGTAKKDYAPGEKVCILSPNGLEQVRKNKKLLKITSFYLDVNDDVLKERLMRRRDNKDEIKRRFSQDEKDFNEIHSKVDFSISNNGILSIPEISDMIIYAYLGKDN